MLFKYVYECSKTIKKDMGKKKANSEEQKGDEIGVRYTGNLNRILYFLCCITIL